MKFPDSFLHPSNWFFPESRRYGLEVSASKNDILKIKDFIQGVCRAAGCSSADTDVIQSVLEKVCVDIARYAYPNRPDGKIQLETSIGLVGLRIHIWDQGQAFDFKGIDDSDLKHHVEMGRGDVWGLWFIRKTTTRIYYERHLNHNEWILYYRPSGEKSQSKAPGKEIDGVSFKFILASFVFFSFLIFLVYVLSCLFVAPALQVNDSIIQRIAEGSKTSLGRGILLLYGLGLGGFFLIYFKLNPFRKVQDRQTSESTPNALQPVQARGEYERLLGVITEMDGKLKGLQARLFDHEELQMEMRVVANERQEETREIAQTQKELSRLSEMKSDLDRQLKEARKRIIDQENVQADLQKEIKAVEQIEQTLLPAELPRLEGFGMGVSYRPAKKKGGNYYDFIWIDPITLGVVVGDIYENGNPDFTVISTIRTAMRLEARGKKSPAEVLLQVYRHVHTDMAKGVFAAMSYLILDSKNRSVSYGAAGQRPMILYRKSTDEIYFLKPKGVPLGMVLSDTKKSSKIFTVQKLNLQKEDLLCIYTDGVIQAVNAERENFGENRLVELIRNNAHLTAEELIRKWEADIADFTAGAEPKDDMILVIVKEKFLSDDMVYQFRKDLLNLVEKDQLPVAEACQKMGVSTQTYYYYKNIYDKKGNAGLRPVIAKKSAVGNGLSLTEKNAVISVIKARPELGSSQITAYLKNNSRPRLRLNVKAVSEFLSWKGLDEVKARKNFAANEIDTV